MAKRTSTPPAPPERPRLTVSAAEAAGLIEKQILEGEKLLEFAKTATSPTAYIERDKPWRDYTNDLLRKILTTDAFTDEFTGWGSGSWDRDPRTYLRNLAKQTDASVLALKSIRGRLELFDEIPSAARKIAPAASASPIQPSTREVFIVHGRDDATKQTVARFLEKLNLTPVILHEQPDRGRTLIEKFEDHSAVGFAVVLLTPDDEGGLSGSGHLQRRARQNVILELGFFIGRLGRRGVCALKDDGVEEPSDLHGVIYVPIDAGGAWMLRLAKELRAAGLDIDMNRAV